jgi:membrane-bound lytic murein transglycosylase D
MVVPPNRCPMYSKSSLAPAILAAAVLALGACAPSVHSLPVSAPAPLELEVEPEELGIGGEIDEAEVKVSERDLLGTTLYDLPVEANTWVEAELDYLVGQRAAVIGRWMERGEPYEGFVKSVLAEQGLPTDLFHLAMIESGFVPTARSRAGAVGLWQFMPATARLEGLRVDGEVDERLDPVRSTYAAARHLQRLHRSFRGDWALAAAAYNAGSGRISRGLQNFSADNFWDLAVWGDLADETKHYVPRLYAMTIIARDRERFGFGPTSGVPAFAVDSVKLDVATPLAELATIGALPLDELSRLNPHLLQRSTPAGNYLVWVPAGTGPAVQHAFMNSEFRRDGGFGTYVVRRGDSLGRIAQNSGVSQARIRALNPRTNWDKLPIGHRVKLPSAAARTIAARSEAAATSSASTAARSTGSATSSSSTAPALAASQSAAASSHHIIRPGETLWGIARKHGVSVAELQKANRLKDATIAPGRSLVIPTASGGNQRLSGAEAATSQKPAEHVVKQGETLWSIARIYSSTTAAIQGLNRMEGEIIRPGQTLLIPR